MQGPVICQETQPILGSCGTAGVWALATTAPVTATPPTIAATGGPFWLGCCWGGACAGGGACGGGLGGAGGAAGAEVWQATRCAPLPPAPLICTLIRVMPPPTIACVRAWMVTSRNAEPSPTQTPPLSPLGSLS